MSEFVNEEAQVLIAYVEEVARHGYVMTVGEFDAYAAQPMAEEAIPLGKVMHQWTGKFLQQIAAASTPGETKLVWLDRLRWLQIERKGSGIGAADRVRVTPLGRAVLAAARQGSQDEQLPTEVALDQGDPIAKARVIERLAGLGEFALVDRYFSVDDYLGVLQRTDVTRILTGPHPKSRISGLQEAAEAVVIDRPFELRIDNDDEFHDRFAIPVSGKILMVGTSLSGVGKRNSVMVELGEGPVAASIRSAFESRWAVAKPVKPPEQPQLEAEVPAAASTDDAESNGAPSSSSD